MTKDEWQCLIGGKNIVDIPTEILAMKKVK